MMMKKAEWKMKKSLFFAQMKNFVTFRFAHESFHDDHLRKIWMAKWFILKTMISCDVDLDVMKRACDL